MSVKFKIYNIKFYLEGGMIMNQEKIGKFIAELRKEKT